MDLRGLTLYLIMALVFVLIYTFFPNKKMRFYMQIPGAMFTSLAWLVFSELFSIYVNNFSTFSTLWISGCYHSGDALAVLLHVHCVHRSGDQPTVSQHFLADVCGNEAPKDTEKG